MPSQPAVPVAETGIYQKVCANCEFYNEIEAPNIDAPGDDTGIFPGRGECMYYPPKIIFDINEGKKESIRPAVHGFDWCGFFNLETIGGDDGTTKKE